MYIYIYIYTGTHSIYEVYRRTATTKIFLQTAYDSHLVISAPVSLMTSIHSSWLRAPSPSLSNLRKLSRSSRNLPSFSRFFWFRANMPPLILKFLYYDTTEKRKPNKSSIDRCTLKSGWPLQSSISSYDDESSNARDKRSHVCESFPFRILKLCAHLLLD